MPLLNADETKIISGKRREARSTLCGTLGHILGQTMKRRVLTSLQDKIRIQRTTTRSFVTRDQTTQRPSQRTSPSHTPLY